uniref:adenine phosphoribosyltransferase 1, chloroplastic-like isoform X2 n=1 Tax=Erigeron canadensis TaxID=72917 RepID=UPI001CB964AF|nr:adenine phosphoribosyltransferase 1, chloroplastic-like isoform X2 [Erigeron canadensis]
MLKKTIFNTINKNSSLLQISRHLSSGNYVILPKPPSIHSFCYHSPTTTAARTITNMMSSSPEHDVTIIKDDRISRISSSIRVIPDFPKPGIMFQDITTMLLDPVAFKSTIDLFVERYKHKNISVVAGVEARGFIFGPPIALAIGAKFVPMRKPNKLPGFHILPSVTPPCMLRCIYHPWLKFSIEHDQL